MNNTQYANRNARIVTRIDRKGKLRTETQHRDDQSVKFAVTTNERLNSTALYIDADDFTVSLTGRQARTLQRLLNKHYDEKQSSQ